MNQIFKVENLNFRWNKTIHPILSDCSFEIEKGSLTSIIGPNGSGKSTLVKILAGLINADSGEIIFSDQNIKKYKSKELAKELSFVEQNVNENIPLTVNELVNLGNYPYFDFFNSHSREEKKRLEFALDITGIKQFKERYFNSLSGGEKQKVMIARAVCQSYKVLVFDEPTSSLDLKNKIETMILLKKLIEEKQSTIIMISHDLGLVKKFSSNICYIKNGKVINIHPEEMNSDLIKDVFYIDNAGIEYADV
jgi:iron complex transport system ATP-binding protein